MRRGLAIIAGLVGLLALAAWLVPPALDASRYRDLLEEVASEALGSPARIEGSLAFTLLPQPRLTATQVRLGESLRVEELRLRVAPLPLLTGHFVAHDLVVIGASLRLPWPPSPGQGFLWSSPWARSYATRIERSSLTLGAMELRDITADVSASDEAMTLQGSARISGQEWRIIARSGSPGRDGHAILALDARAGGRDAPAGLHVDGQVAANGMATAEASFTTADLSQFLPAPAIPVRGTGRLRLTAEGLTAEAWSLTLPSGTAQGDALLHWQGTPRLEMRLNASRMDIDSWGGALGAIQSPALPISLDLGIAAANLAGGTLHQLHGRLNWSGTGITLEDGRAVLPGEANLTLNGTLAGGVFKGAAHLQAPAPATTLRWLEAARPGMPFVPPPQMLPASAELAGQVELSPGSLKFASLRGRLGEVDVSGDLSVGQATPRTAVRADLTLGRLRLDVPVRDLPTDLPTLAQLAARMTGDIQLRVTELRMGSLVSEDIGLDASIADGRLAVRRLGGSLLGAHYELAFALGEDARLADGKFELTTSSATPLPRLLPGAWQGTPALWDAPLALRGDVSGTQDALILRAQAELGDLRVETQDTLDINTWQGSGRISALHPNAGRLMSALGIADPALPGTLRAWAPGWPGEGSFALQTRWVGRDQALTLENTQLTAGNLRGVGNASVTFGGATPVIDVRFQAETLPLPWPPANDQATLPTSRVDGTVQLGADQVQAEDATVARHLACTLSLSRAEQKLSACTMRVADGQATLQATVQAPLADAQEAPTLSLQFNLEAARPAPTVTGRPFYVSEGQVTARLGLIARGHSPAALRATAEGELQISAHDGVLHGINLPAAAIALARAGSEPAEATTDALRMALSSGTTPFTGLSLSAGFARGLLRFSHADLTAPAGAIGMSGTISLTDGTVDTMLAIRPDETPEAELGVAVTGTLGEPVRVPQLLRVLRWLAERSR